MEKQATRRWRSVLFAGLLTFFVAFGATSAIAVTSALKTVGPYNGRTYTNQVLTQNLAPSNIRSYTYVKLTAGSSPPVNTYGGQPRTYSGGTLCAAGSMSYNATGVGGISPSVVGICDPGLPHYGYGRSTHHDGSAYITVDTYTTTNIYP